MNFQELQNRLSQIKEIAVISRNAEIDGVICHIMGMVLLDDRTLQMLILEYDEAYREKLENAEIAELTVSPGELMTNRIVQRGDRNLKPTQCFCCVEKVCFGDLELTTNESGSGKCGTEQWDKVALFTQFLLKGWSPVSLDTKDIGAMFLTNLNFVGTYDAIPAFDTGVSIRFSMRRNSIRHLVEMPVTLIVGTEYPDKLHFTDKVSGEQHWVQINRVTLCDMWTEMSKTFDNPRLKEQVSPEELARSKAEFEERFSEMCPKGMYYPVIEYECEEDISLQFYSKGWLDVEPIHKNSALGFFMKTDEPMGKLGLKLKADIIQEPMTANTVSIEAELFQYSQVDKSDDIVIA
ncbi:hypothetical protein Desor_3097 [Desulfosporosinus orientis DSM 765]|uniref:Uncharacterized protein n=1 Tax=Desulfosporosinus orientis (strain ATCC 19365 / DSM 765 / NCIMB 8382 / VKM B-1628 / Singapore I) TaxID=768706 RepID=G7W6H8_DESOD|nr:hypothetical protein [Desulfosporosinus orientis]AET68616.1 hypothetical protein Desor_3097 [Desulfosporosinus orientis DSM 765]